jgi:hypothetical protein
VLLSLSTAPPTTKCGGGLPLPLSSRHEFLHLHATPLRYARFYLLPRLAHSASDASPTSLLRLPVSPRRISPEPTQAPSFLIHDAFLFSRARSSSLGDGAPRWLSCYNITTINQRHPEIAAIKLPMPKLVTSCKQFLKKTKNMCMTFNLN